jgi:hypothetical protein
MKPDLQKKIAGLPPKWPHSTFSVCLRDNSQITGTAIRNLANYGILEGNRSDARPPKTVLWHLGHRHFRVL